MNNVLITDSSRLLQTSFGRFERYLLDMQTEEATVVDYKAPQQLQKLVDFGISKTGLNDEKFTQLIDQYLGYSISTGNKQFLNQLYAGFNLPAFLGDVLTSLTNTSMYTYEVAPMATLIETEMIQLMCAYAGFNEGDGIFISGGSNGNLLAMLSARNKMLPNSRFHGYNASSKLVAFVNEKAHYSFDTAANVLGIGSNNVVKVKSDSNGRMDTQALEKAIEEAKGKNMHPFFVVATCATTMQGAYDPIDEIATIAKKHGMWLHADGSFGGSVILSKHHRHLMKSIEKADSFVWNPHKLMNIPLVCSVFLVNNKKTLRFNLTDLNTDYIYHENIEDVDLGKKSIQCGRHVDAVKLWFAWKYYGLDGYEKRIDNLMDMAAYAEETVKCHPRLELMTARQSFAVCFRYVPDKALDLNSFNLEIREFLRKSGKSIVNYGYLGKDLCIRLVLVNGLLNQSDVDRFFDHFLEAAEQVVEKL